MINDLTNMERAEVLTAALPYIRRYTGKVVVVKYGGNAMINDQLKQQVMEDIVLLWLIGVRIVLVHGGGPEINELMDRLGKKPAGRGDREVAWRRGGFLRLDADLPQNGYRHLHLPVCAVLQEYPQGA